MTSVTATLKKLRKSSYDGILTIVNSTNNDISNWTITCNTLPSGSTIDKCEKCDVENSGSGVLITPTRKKILTLTANTTLELDFSGEGQTLPTDFTFNGGGSPTGPSGSTGPSGPTGSSGSSGSTGSTGSSGPTGPVNYLYNLPITNMTNISELTDSGFEYQWSYDKQTGYSSTNPNPDYFKLNQPNGLEINLYETDKTFKAGSPTQPRTELRGLKKILDNVEYTISFDQFLVNKPEYDFCWLQIFGGNGPNLILRWRSGGYQLLSDQGAHVTVKFPENVTLDGDVGVWTNWKMVFYLSKSNGYTNVYRNNVLMCSTSGIDNSGANDSYLKHGMYAQTKPKNNVTTYTKNLFLYS